MPHRSANDADANFASFFRQSLSVVTDAVLIGARKPQFRILFYDPHPKLERKNDLPPLLLSIQQTYQIIPIGETKEFKAKTLSFSYGVWTENDREILRYEWHPSTRRLKWPHLHVLPSPYDREISDNHFPTGRLCIEDFVYLLVRDMGVKPRLPYDEWKKILSTNREAFIRQATWRYTPEIQM